MRIILGVAGMDAVQKATDAVNRVTTAAQNSAEAVNASAGASGKASGLFQRLNDSLNETASRYGNVIKAGFELELVGQRIAAVGQKGIDVLHDSLDAWGDYEFTLNRAAGALGIWDKNSTATQLGTDALNTAVHAAAEELRIFPAADVAKAVYFWGSATGQTVKTQKDLKSVMAAVNPIMKASAVTQTDYETAIKGVYSILVQYHKPVGSAADVTNKLLLATQKTALEFPDLINAFKFAGPMASSLGVKFEDVAILLGRLGDAGIRGTMAGRALSMTFTKLVAPTEKGKKALDAVFKSTKGLGKGFDDIVFPKGKFIGMEGLLNDLSKATEHMTMKEKDNFIAQFATQNELRILIPLIDQQTKLRHKDANAIDLQKYSLNSAGAAATKMFDLLKNSWQGTMGALSRVFETITHLVGEELAKMLTPVIDGIGKLATAFEDLLKNNPGLTDLIIKVLAVVSAVLVIVGTLAALAGGIALVTGALGMLTPLLGIVAGALSPIGLAILGIVAVLAVLYKAWTENWGGIQQVVGKVAGFITGTVIPTLSNLVSTAANVASTVANFFTTVVVPALQQFGAVVGTVVGAVVGFIANDLIPTFATIYTFVVGTVIPSLINAWNSVMSVVGPILSWFAATVGDVFFNQVVPAIQGLISQGIAILNEAFATIGPVVASVVAFFETLVEFITKTMAPVWNFIGMVVTAVMDTILKVISAIVPILVDSILKPFLTWLVDTFSAAFKAVSLIVSGAMQVIQGIFEVVTSVIKGIVDVFTAILKGDFSGAFEAIKRTVSGVMNGIRNIIEGILNAVAGAVGFALDRVFNLFKAIFTGILNFIKGLFNTFVEAGGNIVQGLINGITSMVKNLFNFAKSLGTNIINGIGSAIGGLGNAPAALVNIGKNVIEGLWHGIQQMAGWIADRVHDLVLNIIPGPIRDALGIHSPSRVTMELGKMVALGLSAGIVGSTPAVLNSVDTLTGAVLARTAQANGNLSDAMSGFSTSTNFSLSSDNTKTITLRVEVVSPDGSVDSLTADQIAGLLKGSDMVTAIEHAASLD